MADLLKHLKEIAKLLKVPAGQLSLKDSIPTRVHNNKTHTGCFNIIFSLLSDSNKDLLGNNVLENAEIRQWIEYAFIYVHNAHTSQNCKQVLNELNSILATKTYLVSHRLTIADIFLYYLLLNIVSNLTTLEKETYMNVCRWFDNLQQSADIRQSNASVDFSTNYLTNLVPAKH